MANLLRVSIFGTLPGGEEWSVNPVWEIGPPADVITFAEANAAVAAVNAVNIPATVRGAMTSGTTVTGARVEARSYTGVLEVLAEGLRASAVAGTGVVSHPGQTAFVASLRTAVPGASGRGRMYWPATGQALTGATLRPSVADALSFATGMRDYLVLLEAALDGVIDGTVDLCVWSRTNASCAKVTRILAGDVLDTQRRRRDTLPESYSEMPYPA